jgi:hypothetical protein
MTGATLVVDPNSTALPVTEIRPSVPGRLPDSEELQSCDAELRVDV